MKTLSPKGLFMLSAVLVGLSAGMTLGAGAALPSKQGGLGLSDNKFWGDASALEERAMAPFEESELVGLFLDGPKRASVQTRADVPLVVVRAASIKENTSISLQRRGVLVSTRLESDETWAALAFRQPNKPRRATPRRNPDTLPEGRAVKASRVVLNERIPEVAARSGTWATSFLLFNQHSNQVTTRVEAKQGSKARTQGQGAASARFTPPPVPPTDAPDHPYQARPDSPALTGQASIALASANKTEPAPGKAWMLRGSLLLPVLTRDLVSKKLGRDLGDPPPVAVLPVTILLTGDDDAEPILLPLRVPIHQPLEGAKGQSLARGHFALDLRALLGDQLVPQTYAVWALSRQQISAPIVVQVGSP
jgi:hypothetical protein